MEKVFVTGGAGFIGSNTTKQMLDNGYEVTIFDNLSTGHKSAIDPRAKFIAGDLSDLELLKEAIKGHDSVVHFAGLIIVPESVKKPLLYFKNNLFSSIKLLEAMRLNDVRKIIFSSSAAVYGTPLKVPIKENAAQIPLTPYGASKSAFEKILISYFKCYGINYTSLRYFNAYGPGERHNPETHAIPNFIKSTLSQKPIQVFGDGNQIRDFIYVGDLAAAHMLALSSGKKNILNIGCGNGVTVNALIGKIFEVIGSETKVVYLEPREGDPLELVADISKAKRLLNWEPRISLEEGLKKTADWFRKWKEY